MKKKLKRVSGLAAGSCYWMEIRPAVGYEPDPGMVVWADNQDVNKWYYLTVQEATNTHDYGRKTNGYEKWTGLRPAPDWTALKK